MPAQPSIGAWSAWFRDEFSIAELIGNITRAQRSIAELRQRVIARQQEYRKEVETQIADVGREVSADVEKFRAAKG